MMSDMQEGDSGAADRALDEALAETFPASDPVAIEQPTKADRGADSTSSEG